MTIYFFQKGTAIYCKVANGREGNFNFSTKIKLNTTQKWDGKNKVIKGAPTVDVLAKNERIKNIESGITGIYHQEVLRTGQIPLINTVQGLWKAKSTTINIVKPKAPTLSLKGELDKLRVKIKDDRFLSIKGLPFSASTKSGYSATISVFSEFLDSEGDFDIQDLNGFKATSEESRSEVQYRTEKMYEDFVIFMLKATKTTKNGELLNRFNATSRHTSIGMLKAVISMLNKHINCDISIKYSLKKEKLPIKILSLNQVMDFHNPEYIESLISNANVKERVKIHYRNLYAAMYICLYTTFRVEDLRLLSPKNLYLKKNSDGKTIYRLNSINGKTGQELDFIIHKRIYDKINNLHEGDLKPSTFQIHLHNFLQIIPSFNEEVSLSRKSHDGGSVIVKKIEAYKLHTMHTFRRTAISLMAANGVPIDYIKKLSGHKSDAIYLYVGIFKEEFDNRMDDYYKAADAKYTQN